VLVGTSTDVTSSQLTIDSTTKGVLLPRMTTAQRDAIVSPTVGLQIFNTTAGYLEYFDSFWGWMPIDNSNEWKRRNGTEYFNDFGANTTLNDGVFTTLLLNGGTGNNSSITATGNFIGYQGISTGVQTTGQAIIRTDINAGRFTPLSNRTSLISRLFLGNLSNSTDRYDVIFGFSGGNNSTVNSGCAFIYDEGGAGTGTTASPNWQIITANSGVRTNFVTSVPVVANTWFSFRIESNSTFTELYYYIDDVLVRTETSNIPTGFNLVLPIVSINKRLGTTTRVLLVDYLGLKIKLNNQR
jgi:hypothetical protein